MEIHIPSHFHIVFHTFSLCQLLGKMVHNLLASLKIDEADTLVSSTESDLCLVSSLEANEQLREVEKLRRR